MSKQFETDSFGKCPLLEHWRGEGQGRGENKGDRRREDRRGEETEVLWWPHITRPVIYLYLENARSKGKVTENWDGESFDIWYMIVRTITTWNQFLGWSFEGFAPASFLGTRLFVPGKSLAFNLIAFSIIVLELSRVAFRGRFLSGLCHPSSRRMEKHVLQTSRDSRDSRDSREYECFGPIS